METSSLYDSKEYSDVAIRLSDGRSISCHKVVLCRRSDYFRKLCGTGSRFAENQRSEIKLEDDDPESLEALLRHLYGCTEPSLGEAAGKSTKPAWRFYLNLRTTADKYLLSDLSKDADAEFRIAASLAASNPSTIFNIIQTLQDDMAHDESLIKFAGDLRKEHLHALLKNEAYRAHLDDNKDLLWEQLDELLYATDLVEEKITYCSKHPHVFWSDNVKSGACGVCEASTTMSLFGSTKLSKMCWIRKIEPSKFVFGHVS